MDPRVSPGSPYSRFFGHTPGKEYSRNNVLFLKAGHWGPSHSGQTSTPWPGQSAPHEWLFPQCACTGPQRFPRHAVGSQKFWPFPGNMSVPWKQVPSRTQFQWYVPPGSLGVGCAYCVTFGWISASDPTQPKGPPQISQREGSFAPTLHANFRLCASWWHRHGAGIASHVVMDFALDEPITSTWLGTSWDAFDQLSQHMESNPST